jgi:hypothetical protein
MCTVAISEPLPQWLHSIILLAQIAGSVPHGSLPDSFSDLQISSGIPAGQQSIILSSW